MGNLHGNWRVTVDRIEGDTFMLVGDDDRLHEVPRKDLPFDCRGQGAVLDVPVDERNTPQWSSARRNTGEEALRRREIRQALDQLRKRDAQA